VALRAGSTCWLPNPGAEVILWGMISKRERATITALARRYGVSRVWVFGSKADQGERGRDVDLAVAQLARRSANP